MNRDHVELTMFRVRRELKAYEARKAKAKKMRCHALNPNVRTVTKIPMSAKARKRWLNRASLGAYVTRDQTHF